MGDGDDRSGIPLQMLFKPGHGLGIEMVGRLIEEQNIGLSEQEPAQCHAPSLSTRKDFHGCLSRGAPEGFHGHFEARIEIPGIEGVKFLLHLALFFDKAIHLLFRQGL